MEDYEKLGAFYLGRSFELKQKKPAGGLLLYASKDLVTHAVCVGMTGSGKTGLCIAMLEEAAIDNIPSIIIDPKGDLANLMLTFPELKPEDFAPWVNEEDAKKKNLSTADYAAQQADFWKKGLADWSGWWSYQKLETQLSAASIRLVVIQVPVSILVVAAPPAAIRKITNYTERINTTVTSLLGLLSIDADPIKNRGTF